MRFLIRFLHKGLFGFKRMMSNIMYSVTIPTLISVRRLSIITRRAGGGGGCVSRRVSAACGGCGNTSSQHSCVRRAPPLVDESGPLWGRSTRRLCEALAAVCCRVFVGRAHQTLLTLMARRKQPPPRFDAIMSNYGCFAWLDCWKCLLLYLRHARAGLGRGTYRAGGTCAGPIGFSFCTAAFSLAQPADRLMFAAEFGRTEGSRLRCNGRILCSCNQEIQRLSLVQ